MRRIAVIASVVTSVAASAAVARATHVVESDAPITSVHIEVSDYPGGPLPCDGSVPIPDESARIETIVKFDAGGTGDPSEHWDIRRTIEREVLQRDGSTVWKLDWEDIPFRHQNAGPHTPLEQFETGQTNQYNLAQPGGTGRWRVTALVIGLASGKELEASCIFSTSVSPRGK